MQSLTAAEARAGLTSDDRSFKKLSLWRKMQQDMEKSAVPNKHEKVFTFQSNKNEI